MVAGGHRCGCGARGCVEQYASGSALVRAAREAVDQGRLPTPGADETVTPEWLHRLARKGHAGARDIYADAGNYLGLALAAVVNLLDITVFFIGGGVAGAFDVLQPPLASSIRRHAFGLDPGDLVVARATCGNDAGMIGASGQGDAKGLQAALASGDASGRRDIFFCGAKPWAGVGVVQRIRGVVFAGTEKRFRRCGYGSSY